VKDIVVWAELREGKVVDVSFEMITKAVELGDTLGGSVIAVVIGDTCSSCANELISYGADRVVAVEDSRLALYQSGAYARVLADVLVDRAPEVTLIGGTSVGMDLAPRVAAILETGLTAHCVDLYIDTIDGTDQLVQVVPGWGGKIMIKILCPEQRPQMATVRPGVMEKGIPDYSRKGEIVAMTPDLNDDDFMARTLEFVKEKETGVVLESADIVVSGGFGLYASGGFQLVEQLADALGGEVAGTRPAFDHGWITEERMIGQSGKTLRPRLFVSVGASGAMHYTTGFQKAKVIVAIDRNPDAPIFTVSDIGIVGDLNTIVPRIIEELQEKKIQ